MQKSTTVVSRWGNSLGIRLPKALAKEAGLREGDPVELNSEGGSVVMRRAKRRYTLDQLLDSIKPGMVEPIDWGGPVGAERFWEDE